MTVLVDLRTIENNTPCECSVVMTLLCSHLYSNSWHLPPEIFRGCEIGVWEGRAVRGDVFELCHRVVIEIQFVRQPFLSHVGTVLTVALSNGRSPCAASGSKRRSTLPANRNSQSGLRRPRADIGKCGGSYIKQIDLGLGLR